MFRKENNIMRNNYLYKLLLVITLVNGVTFSQKPTQTNTDYSFNDFLKGVKYAAVIFGDEAQKEIDEGKYFTYTYYIKEFLKSIGFGYVAVTTEEKLKLQDAMESVCISCGVYFENKTKKGEYSDIKIIFQSCDDKLYQFSSNIVINENLSELKDVWQGLVYNKKPNYNEKYLLKLEKEMTDWDESKLKSYYINNGAKNLEGIYENLKLSSDEKQAKYKIGIVKNKDDGYDVVYIDGAKNYLDWIEGEIKARILKTGTPNLYKVNWNMANKSLNEDVVCFLDEMNILNFHFSEGNMDNPDIKYIKLFPPISEDGVTQEFASSGSGIILSNEGYIATCLHVVDASNKITVELSADNSNKIYEAVLIAKDKDNDLAIIKTNESLVNAGISNININTVLRVGDKAFALGYPLISSMGNELKVTDGIISAKTGYEGSINQYTISVPVQPGNSGGPLFDYYGNLIGIVNAKHTNTDNVSYAIKCSYLKNLLETYNINLNYAENTITNYDLPTLINSLRNSVVLIKTR